MKLSLGVLDIPYAAPEPSTKKKKKQTAPRQSVTTGDVAEILEAHYHPMEIYWETHGQEAADKMTEGLVGAMENLLAGAPLTTAPFKEAEEFIDSSFKNFINTGEMESMGYPGVPTKAALERKSGRFKKGKGKNQRPSFVDTGQFVASFKSEIKED